MMRTVTLKLSERLDCRLRALAKRQRTSRAQVLREALEAFIAHSPPLTFGELAVDLDGILYRDLGPGHFDAINRDRSAKSLARRLNALGFDVDVRPVAA